ncbi:MAG: hypothetical protein KAS64_08235 [Spirochaetes bacterium]|nr:hypothetical protein [Spirochaetota bacterium]
MKHTALKHLIIFFLIWTAIPALINANNKIQLVKYDDSTEDEDLLEDKSKNGKGSPLFYHKQRIKKIRSLLIATSRKIRGIRKKIRKIARLIIHNERLIANSSISMLRKVALIKKNIRLFKAVEHIRIEITNIQFSTARKVFKIEKNTHRIITKNVIKNIREIKKNPANYWLKRRRQILRRQDRNMQLSKLELREIYKLIK